MQFLKLALLVGGLLLLSSSVTLGQETWRTGPSTTAQNAAGTGFPLCDLTISPGKTCYWTFNNPDAGTLSPVINVTAEYAIVTFNSNIAGTNDTNEIIIYKVAATACSGATASVNTAVGVDFRIADPTADWSVLVTGATGRRMVTIPIGCYFIDPDTVTTEDAMIMITGAPVGRQ